nr:MAG TPA: hypothetical protein [Caudoviricetes sp.]
MKYKECIKKIGLKNVILYEMFYILEIILNLPYLMLRGIAIIYDDILEFIVFITKKQQNLLARIFGKTRIINLSKLSKRIDDFRLKTIKELKKENEELKFEERRRIIGKYGDAEIHDVINKILSNDYIPVQKVKDNIKKLEIKKEKARGERNILERFAIEKSINSLQELLEGRE